MSWECHTRRLPPASMTRSGHHFTSLGAAAIAFSVAHRHHGYPWLAAMLAVPGATAPDWPELAWFRRACATA